MPIAALCADLIRASPSRKQDGRIKSGHDVVGQRALAFSRSLNFWILPVEVLGISAKTTCRGHLKCASPSRHQAISSSVVAAAPGLSSTNAHGVSPHLSSGLATTAAAPTAGCL